MGWPCCENGFWQTSAKAFSCWMDKKRLVGCPEFTFGRGLYKALKTAKRDKNMWSELAQDRALWSRLISNFWSTLIFCPIFAFLRQCLFFAFFQHDFLFPCDFSALICRFVLWSSREYSLNFYISRLFLLWFLVYLYLQYTCIFSIICSRPILLNWGGIYLLTYLYLFGKYTFSFIEFLYY